jgi:hypothetical protein
MLLSLANGVAAASATDDGGSVMRQKIRDIRVWNYVSIQALELGAGAGSWSWSLPSALHGRGDVADKTQTPIILIKRQPSQAVERCMQQVNRYLSWMAEGAKNVG